MKLIFPTTFMLIIVNAAPAWAIDLADEAQRIFTKVSTSVVTIKTYDAKGNPEAQGSGVVVGVGLIASNCHVIEEATSIRVIAAQGEMAAEWLRKSPGLDLCLLKAEGLQATPLPLRLSHSLKVGEPTYAVGNPLGFGLAVSKGLIAVVRQAEPYPLILATAAQSPGSSGGGLFDAEGRLIGITTAVMGAGQNVNLILAADGLNALITKGTPRPPIPLIPVPERRWLDEAEVMQRSGNWPALEKLALDWSQLQPLSARPLVSMGMAQYELKRYVEAETTLRKSIALDEHHAFAWINLASVLENLGQSEEAERALQQAERLVPSYAEPSRRRAEWYKKQGKPAAALLQIKEAIRKDPGRSFMWEIRGKIEDSLGHKDEALHAFAIALRLGSADAEVQRRLAKLPVQSDAVNGAAQLTVMTDAGNKDESRAQLVVGLYDMQLGRLAQAEDAIRKAISLAPDSSEAWNGLGSVFLKTMRYAEAEDAYTKAMTLDVNNLEPLINRAIARRARNKMDLALDDATRAITLFPQSEGAWKGYALINLDLRDYARANSGFAKMDGLTKMDADYLVSWGESLVGAGQLDAAQKVLQKAEAIDPKLARTFLSMAKLLGRKGDIEGALKYENRVLELEPTNVHAWSGKGYALMKLNKLPEAIEALETAVRLDPELNNAWINLGEAQMRKQNFGRAIQALEKAIGLAPAAMDARLYLAQSYLSVRLPLKSREQAQKLLDKQPDFVPALSLMTTAYLMEGNDTAASPVYSKLKTLSPAAARSVRDRAIAGGLAGAKNLLE
ncbi:MAG: tetratricopeptide repeat protein [Undibacterium sp.]|uniref:tetratricopeptide repeat protein n=1 Tax=Undibacterium sp. TaxID=1914977 RepID=UPI0027265B02|nr:tetratricopeptide repeat protein [Undibacterium sp.]MDO8651754.1 tetratricopeptide repeat protein [Undibacterium sp.]